MKQRQQHIRNQVQPRRRTNAEESPNIEALQRDPARHPLFFEKSRTDQHAADCEEQIYAQIAILMDQAGAEDPELMHPVVIANHRENRDRPPAVE